MPPFAGTGTLLDATKQMGWPAKRLIASYASDWIIIILFAAVGGALSFVEPYHRPFSLLNLEISNPYIHESISTSTLVLVSLAAPALLIAIITLVFVPGSHVRRVSTRTQVAKLKLWELEKGLAGLCLSLAVAFFVTQGMKNIFGKPRPNLLDRCKPDLSNIAEHVVGGFGQDISARWTLVDVSICTQTDADLLNDGFRSFPSGHSSWSWSGLLYLTLFFCSKFAIGIPHLPGMVTSQTTDPTERRVGDQEVEMLPLHSNRARGDSEDTKQEPSQTVDQGHIRVSNPLSVRNAAAAPPNYLIIPALLPVGVAIYICSTRYVEFYHFGFDIISGSLIGITTAYLSFRWYHLPISRGQGWAWGARSKDRAFAIGVGTGGYVGEEGWQRTRALQGDIEAGPA